MADKTIISKRATIGVACPKQSALKADEAGKPIAGQYETVVIKHIKAGTPVTMEASEADRLIALGVAEEVKASTPAKSK